ncbi:MAG TPA: hypothetical protein VH350_05120 [Candidatus Sulfotelmatobacter sp.]|nr:hypothetical protein [Candidatus Sulfotelmatobacter sp.]
MILVYSAIVLLILATAYSTVVSFRHKPEDAQPSWLFPERPKRPARIIVGFVTLVLVIAVGAWIKLNVANPNTQNSALHSYRFLIPEGYTGWVRIEFEIPGAPALPIQSSHTMVKIPPSGTLKTSSSEQYGAASDDYASYSNDTVRPLPDSGPEKRVWGKITGELQGPGGNRKYEEFFVGSEQQFKSQTLPPKPKE